MKKKSNKEREKREKGQRKTGREGYVLPFLCFPDSPLPFFIVLPLSLFR
jgi:hypothetical protein